MKRIMLKSQYCGPGGVFPPGREIEVDDYEAAEMVKHGHAEAIKPPTKAKPKGKAAKK